MTTGWLATEARAKLNLRLRIFPRRPDGYHPLETIFCRINLADRVRVRRRREPGVSIRLSGPEPAPLGPENLAARAALAFLKRTGLTGGVAIELEKHIPVASGLGGGSSDAAAVLRLLGHSAESPVREEALLQWAAELGADVPFFVADSPMSLAWGRGDRLLACAPIPTRPMLIVVSDIRIATAEAYAEWDERRSVRHSASASEPVALSGPLLADWQGLRSLAVNDFEPVVFGRYPSLRTIRRRLDETRPLLALLCGSGSAVFAAYGTEEACGEAASRLGEEFEGVRVFSACGPV